MEYEKGHKTCDRCKSTYLSGVPHTCDHNDVDASRARLENWLVDWTVEGPHFPAQT